MFTTFAEVLIGLGSYAVGAFTWPYIHKWAVGAEAYAMKLRVKAAAIAAAAKG